MLLFSIKEINGNYNGKHVEKLTMFLCSSRNKIRSSYSLHTSQTVGSSDPLTTSEFRDFLLKPGPL